MPRSSWTANSARCWAVVSSSVRSRSFWVSRRRPMSSPCVPCATRTALGTKRTMADQERPFPPGAYPVIVIGSGPGGLQVAYELAREGIGHAVLSADEGPGGMFLRGAFFQRLLSWAKAYA